jgi:hypothetical protein
MRCWLAEGRITPESQVWREGWRDWKEAAEVFPEDAFPQLRIPDTVPELERILGDDNSATSPGGFHHGDGRTSLVSHLVITLVLIALGGGILAAVYVWARFY